MSSAVPTELAGLVARTLEIDARLVTAQASFADLGRTSFAEVELINLIEDHYHITLDFETFLGLETVGALADAITEASRVG